MKISKYIFFIFLVFLSTQVLAQSNEQTIEQLIKQGYHKMGNDSIESSPIIYKKNSLVFLKVIINGKEYLFLFDTGASICLISEEIASQSAVQNTIHFTDEYENKSKANVVLQNIQIGNSSFNNIVCVVNDMKILTTLGCVKIDGIIGANLINLCNWKIDPVKNLLSFSKSTFKKQEISELELEIKYTGNGLPLIKLNYDNTPFYTLIDFGFSDYLELNNDILKKSKKIRKTNQIKGFGIHSLTINSIIESKVSRLLIDTLRSESFTLINVPTTLNESKPKIGSSLLKRYLVKLNSLERKLILIPLQDIDSTTLSFPIKFGLNDLNEIIINFIWETEDTKNLGLKIGQKVIKIDNKEFNNLSNSDLCELKDQLNQKSSINITILVGSKLREVQLSKIIM